MYITEHPSFTFQIQMMIVIVFIGIIGGLGEAHVDILDDFSSLMATTSCDYRSR